MSDRFAEAFPYAVAVVILVGAGAVLRTVVLNWFIGPTIVFVSVAILRPIIDRKRQP